MRKNKTIRMDPLADVRLQSMAKDAGISQSELMEELVMACFDEACEGYKVRDDSPNNKGFDRLLASMNYRVRLQEQE